MKIPEIAATLISLAGTATSHKGSDLDAINVSKNGQKKNNNYSDLSQENGLGSVGGMLANYFMNKIGAGSSSGNPTNVDTSKIKWNEVNSYTPSNNTREAASGGRLYPNGGELTQYNGYKHAQGGIPLGKNEVEDGETSIDGKYIFPDKGFTDEKGKTITVPGTKKTFAQQSKNIDSKYSLRPWDSITKDSKKRELGDLKDTHKTIQTAMDIKAIQKIQSKYPGLLERFSETNTESIGQQFKGGGFWNTGIGKAVKYGNPAGPLLYLNDLGKKDNEARDAMTNKVNDYQAEQVDYNPYTAATLGKPETYTGQGYNATMARAEKIDLNDIKQLRAKEFQREDNREELKQFDDYTQRSVRAAMSDPTAGNSTVAALAATAVGAKNKSSAMADFNNRQAVRKDTYNQYTSGLEAQNISNRLGAMSTNAQIGTNVNMANAASKNSALAFTSNALNQSNQFNVGQKNQVSMFNTSSLNDANKFNTQMNYTARSADADRREAKWNAEMAQMQQMYKVDNSGAKGFVKSLKFW